LLIEVCLTGDVRVCATRCSRRV